DIGAAPGAFESDGAADSAGSSGYDDSLAFKILHAWFSVDKRRASGFGPRRRAFDDRAILPDVSEVIVAEAAVEFAVIGRLFSTERGRNPRVQHPFLGARRLAQGIAPHHHLHRGGLGDGGEQGDEFAFVAGEFGPR